MQEKVAGLRVFKFGGASVKDAAAILNLCAIVKREAERGPLLVVVSAMGKTTNALEYLFERAGNGLGFEDELLELEAYHLLVAVEFGKLSPMAFQAKANVESKISELIDDLRGILIDLQVARIEDNDEQYDQVVRYGEQFATLMVTTGLANFISPAKIHRIGAGTMIQTDSCWRDAKVDWEATEQQTKRSLAVALSNKICVVVTEGFIGNTSTGGNNKYTTLGREGSDYSAAIFAYCLRAESVTIWKDVPGLLNADPKVFANTVLYPEISYRETIEMAFYGASVIHPKTLKPLAERGIPLYVKSFLDPKAAGTIIHDCQHPPLSPAFIRKTDQCLISFESKDFAFISEENLAVIFAALVQARLKINVMQNSAISFSICTDYSKRRLGVLLELLGEQFRVHHNSGLLLFTIKNYDAASIERVVGGREVFLEQRTRGTFQAVCAA